MLNNLKLWLVNVAGFLIANPVFIAAIFAVILIIAAFTQIQSCRQGTWNKKVEKTKEEILTDKIEANVLVNIQTNVRREVNTSANKTNSAINDFRNAANRDSANYNGSNAAVTDKFCSRFCADSSCIEWRKTNECKQ